MALATQCPHCHTTFRVAHDQLKLRAGLVRCGACKQIFNGIENLLQAENPEQVNQLAPAPQPPAWEAATHITPPSDISETPTSPAANNRLAPEPESPDAENQPSDESDEPPAAIEHEPIEQETTDDPLLRMTLMDFTQDQHEQAEVDGTQTTLKAGPDPLERAIDDLQHKPWRRKSQESMSEDADQLDQADAADYEEPSFVKQGRRKQRINRALHIFMALASILLLAGLLAQSTYVFRNQLAAWFPQTRQALAEACTYLGCQVGLPAQIESVSIESSELQTLAANSNTFTLTVLLRNHGATEQAWPNLELTLNDANEKAIARRVFLPRDYLPSALEARKGFGAKSEQPIKLFFQVSQLNASGYRVYLFYP